MVRGEKYGGSEFYPNVTITNDTISFNIGILISHLNESGLKERELKVVEWTHSASRVVIKKEERRILFNFSTSVLTFSGTPLAFQNLRKNALSKLSC